MYMVSFTIGLIIVISSLFLMRNELNRAIKKQEQILEQSKLYKEGDLFNLLEALQVSIDEMNHAFYEIADDLEGKYSIHEKEINDLAQLVNDIKTLSVGKIEKVIAQNADSQTESLKDIQSNLSKMQQQFDKKNREQNRNHIQNQSNDKYRFFEPSEWLSDDEENSTDMVLGTIARPNKGNDKAIDQTLTFDSNELETIDKIILLRSQGKSLTQIAKELGIGMGEIQLLLSLKK